MQVPLTQSQVEGRRRYDLVGIGSLSTEPQMRFDRVARTTDGRRYVLTHRLGERQEVQSVALDDSGRIVARAGRISGSRWSAGPQSVDWYGTRFRFHPQGRRDPVYRLETEDRRPMATFTPFSSVLDLAQPVDPGLLGSLAILHTPDGRPLTTVGSNCNWTGPEPGIIGCYESVDPGLVLCLLRVLLDRVFEPDTSH